MVARQFVHIRLELDALVDDKIQPLALQTLFAPRREADQETTRGIRTVLFLMLIFVLSVVSVTLLLIRTITRPVRTLMHGTQVVSRGDLDYRLGSLDRDEFGELAEHFNHMVAELQATAVSKVLLQESEAKLPETIGAWRREIMARTSIQASLHQLKPVLRAKDYTDFNLQQALGIVTRLAKMIAG